MKKGVISALSTIVGATAGAGFTARQITKEVKRQKELADKHLALYLLMNQWVKVKQEKKSITDYLKKNGYKEIAIYGMNYVGETLLNELAGSDIKVKYAIDKNADNIFMDIDVVLPDQTLDKVDAVIVTPITFFDEIEELLAKKIKCPILSVEDILYGV